MFNDEQSNICKSEKEESVLVTEIHLENNNNNNNNNINGNIEIKLLNNDEEKKQKIELPQKSSMEILSELFECFDAEPPVIIKKEKSDTSQKKFKKNKKKQKHKDKKHKKKERKRKREQINDKNEIDLSKILIKEEKEITEKKIKIEGTDLSIALKTINNNDDNKIIEDGEISSESNQQEKKLKKRKHKSEKVKTKKRKKNPSHNKMLLNDLRLKLKSKDKFRERSSSRSKNKDDNFYRNRNDFYMSTINKMSSKNQMKSKSRSCSRSRSRSQSRSRSRSRSYSRSRSRSKGRDRDRRDYKSRESSRTRKSKSSEDFYKSSREKYNREREKNHRNRMDFIDKKKLLEIARRNAIQMMKSGSLPGALTLGRQAQEKVIAAIKAGGKTIEELTDFCKTLSKQEALGDLSSGPDDNGSDSETDKPFHHPFQLKDRPTSITMNIKNSIPLPIKTTQERTTELRMQFPVSSGQLHRKTENEWVPVSPKKIIETSVPKISNSPLHIETVSDQVSVPTTISVTSPSQPSPISIGPQVLPNVTMEEVDIGSIVSQRLSAMRKLQEDPNDVQALSEIYKSTKEMQTWAQSKQQPGQFTGSTGANILSQAELSSGYQAWARKDQLQSATPVSGGMGMHLLQKMGWKPGEGLGKEKTGTLEPLLLEVKLDKKGLVANEEQKKKKIKQQWNNLNVTTQNKHPVSLLGEYASKKKLGAPEYTLCFECGPDHKKNFLFKVCINGVEYRPNIASPNKKEAKAAAATICLQQLGLLP